MFYLNFIFELYVVEHIHKTYKPGFILYKMVKLKSLAQKIYASLNIASFIFAILGAIFIVLYLEEFSNNNFLLTIGVILEICFILVYIPGIYLHIKLKKYNNSSYLQSKWGVILSSIAMLLAIVISIIVIIAISS